MPAYFNERRDQRFKTQFVEEYKRFIENRFIATLFFLS